MMLQFPTFNQIEKNWLVRFYTIFPIFFCVRSSYSTYFNLNFYVIFFLCTYFDAFLLIFLMNLTGGLYKVLLLYESNTVRSISPYSVRMRENTDQKYNSVFGKFSRSESSQEWTKQKLWKIAFQKFKEIRSAWQIILLQIIYKAILHKSYLVHSGIL